MQMQPFANVLQNQSARDNLQKAVLRDFPKFRRKHLCQSLFITKVEGQGRQLYLKRDPGTGVSCEFAKFGRAPFLTEHLSASAASSSSE